MPVQTTSGQALPRTGVVTLIAALHDADQNTIHVHRFTGEVTEAIIACRDFLLPGEAGNSLEGLLPAEVAGLIAEAMQDSRSMLVNIVAI
jgi:hypothetical protein